jgi:hypothetical protein
LDRFFGFDQRRIQELAGSFTDRSTAHPRSSITSTAPR